MENKLLISYTVYEPNLKYIEKYMREKFETMLIGYTQDAIEFRLDYNHETETLVVDYDIFNHTVHDIIFESVA